MATSTLDQQALTQQVADSTSNTFVFDPTRKYSEHPTAPEPQHPDLSFTKTTMRGFEKIIEKENYAKDGEGKPLIGPDGKKIILSISYTHKKSAQAETQKKDQKTGISENWVKAEKEGFRRTNENQIRRPYIKSIAAFLALVGGDEQRACEIIQDGIDTNCNSLSNQIMTEYQEGTGQNNVPAVAIHNDEVIELWELLQERKRNQRLSPQDATMKKLLGYGMTPEQMLAMLQELQDRVRSSSAAGATIALPQGTEEDEPSEGEGEEEEGEEETPVTA